MAPISQAIKKQAEHFFIHFQVRNLLLELHCGFTTTLYFSVKGAKEQEQQASEEPLGLGLQEGNRMAPRLLSAYDWRLSWSLFLAAGVLLTPG